MASSGSRFRSPEAALALRSGSERVVRLTFRGGAPGDGSKQPGACLFVHPAILRASSRVLANVLEDTACAADAADSFISIPLDEADPTAWEEALQLMHPPAAELFAITWDNAARLLRLAHKYDAPGIQGAGEVSCLRSALVPNISAHLPRRSMPLLHATAARVRHSTARRAACLPWPAAHVAAFLKPRPALAAGSGGLAAHLTEQTAWEWLQLTSACSLDAMADTCIDFIISRRLPVSYAALSGLRS